MEPTIINGSDVTVERSKIGFPQIRITQPDDDIVVLRDHDIDEFIAAIREHTRTVEEPKPAPEKNVVNGVDLRITRIVARVKIQQLRRDVAYEEGRISAIDSILED